MVVEYNLAAALVGNLCGTLILFSILLNSHMLKEGTVSSSKKWLFGMIVVCLLGSISEMVFEIVNGRMFPYAREINIAAKSINHLESFFAGFLFIGFMRAITFENEKSWPKPLKIIGIGACAFAVVLYTVNLGTGIAFTVSEDNHYLRGPLARLGLMVSMAALIYTVVIMVVNNKVINTYLRFPIPTYIMPFIIGAGLQMIHPSMRLSSVAFALVIVTVHLSLQRRILYTDAMTGVFNRTYLDYFFKEMGKKPGGTSLGGLMVDINSFKEINDTYGHGVGDEAIINASNVLKKVSGADCLLIRYGGDEFILIKENANEGELKARKQQMNDEVEAFNRNSDAAYELSFSIGTTMYDTASGGGLSRFLEQMDKALYLDKKAYYERTGKERRR